MYSGIFKHLEPLAGVAEALAAKEDWSPLYDLDVLLTNTVPTAAATYYEDMCGPPDVHCLVFTDLTSPTETTPEFKRPYGILRPCFNFRKLSSVPSPRFFLIIIRNQTFLIRRFSKLEFSFECLAVFRCICLPRGPAQS